jgi:hypothetical protein
MGLNTGRGTGKVADVSSLEIPIYSKPPSRAVVAFTKVQ